MTTGDIQKWVLIGVLAGLLAQFSPAQTTLVSTGSVWKYLDNGSDQGSAWQGLLFDDSAWASGPAQLGYGDGDEATVVNGGPTTNRLITTYFRYAFTEPLPSIITNLAVRLLRDDGGVVYLNGIEIFRSNMPTNDINSTTPALRVVPTIDESTNFYANAVNPLLLLPGANVLAVEIHQASRTSSDISFDLELIGNFTEAPPSVVLATPANGTRLLTANATLAADAYDHDDAIILVEFFQGDTKLGEAVSPPYSLVWSNVPMGNYTLTTVATDSHGLSSTSAPVNVTAPALVPSDALWNFLDDGSAPGVGWQDLAFDDTAWTNGPAQLGYGDGDEATVINGGPSANRFTTYYFRHRFEVSDPAAFTNLVVRLLRDDGGIVYLNGTEVFRSNLPNGPVDSTTWALLVIPNGPEESEYYSTNVDPALLVTGTNVLAVEIHQVNPTSSDISFDLQLIPNLPPTAPTVRITNPAPSPPGLVAPAVLDVDVDAHDFDGTIAQVHIYLDTNLVGVSVSEPYGITISNVVAGTHTLLAVATDHSGLAATSAPVALTVAPAPAITTLIATGSVWKYLDDGSNQGTAWKEIGFDDSLWASGPGVLGYGGAGKSPPRPEATVINSGPLGAKYITDYFRHHFVVSDAPSVTNLSFRVLRDDGVVVYLNGTEMFRMNMPTGAITYATTSSTVVGTTNETFRFPTNVSPALLVSGTNLLAVELHQQSGTTTDAAFDLQMDGISAPFTGPIALRIENTGAELVLSWTADGVVLQKAEGVGGPWSSVPLPVSNPYHTAPTNSSRFYRLQKP